MAHVHIRPPKSLQMCTPKRIITLACSRLQGSNEQRSLKLARVWHRLYQTLHALKNSNTLFALFTHYFKTLSYWVSDLGFHDHLAGHF